MSSEQPTGELERALDENASLRKELQEKSDMLQHAQGELSTNRDPESVSTGEAFDVLYNDGIGSTERKSFACWAAEYGGVRWDLTMQRMEEGALTPSTHIAALEEQLAAEEPDGASQVPE